MSDPLTTLQAYGNPYEAELARGLLESHGIPVFLADQNMARVTSNTSIKWVRLQVRESDLPEARQILEAALSESPPVADEIPREHSCPVCGGNRSKSHSDLSGWLLGVMLLGLPFLIQGRKRKCQICGNVWRG